VRVDVNAPSNPYPIPLHSDSYLLLGPDRFTHCHLTTRHHRTQCTAHLCLRVHSTQHTCGYMVYARTAPHPRYLPWTDLPMGVLSIVLAANDTNNKLSTSTQICSAYSWLNVGGKLLKVVALKRLFTEEREIKRKLQKLSGRWSPSGERAIENSKSREFLAITSLLAASHASTDGTSEPDAAADDEGSRSAWSLRRVTRYGVVRWLGALLNGKTRGRAHSDLELVNAAILQETRRRNASESGEQRKIIVEASRSASVLLETAPQVRRRARFGGPGHWPRSRFQLVNPTKAP
jgi:hypothetical protein